MPDSPREGQPEVPSEGSSDTTRSIELEIEVPGTPEQVWRAIATGPGISSWYVPHSVEERPGGAAEASFGPGPEMKVPGRVAAWEPPHRVVFDGGEGVPGLAFEWLVEARDGGSCVVRLVNTGFGDGGDWDEQFDNMRDGWQLFLLNLRLHLAHFSGQTATPALPMSIWETDPASAWRALGVALGLPEAPAVGDRVRIDPGDGPRLGGTVADVATHRIALVLEEPSPGTAFVAAEGRAQPCTVSVWAYLYGDQRDRRAADVTTAWQHWLDGHRPAPAEQ